MSIQEQGKFLDFRHAPRTRNNCCAACFFKPFIYVVFTFQRVSTVDNLVLNTNDSTTFEFCNG